MYGNPVQAFQAQMTSVSPVQQNLGGVVQSHTFDPEQTRHIINQNMAGFGVGERAESIFNIPYNKSEMVVAAVQETKVEQILFPRWPQQVPPKIDKLIGHVAVLPNLNILSAGLG
jgi:hypothetical protein